MITFDQAKQLKHGQIIYYHACRNADGSPFRYRVNGKVQLKKQNPGFIRIPLKRGLYEYGYLENWSLVRFSLSE